jgi:hypothetical protein
MNAPGNTPKGILEVKQEIGKLKDKASGTVIRISYQDSQIVVIVSIYKDDNEGYLTWDSSGRPAKKYDDPIEALESYETEEYPIVSLSINDISKMKREDIPMGGKQ